MTVISWLKKDRKGSIMNANNDDGNTTIIKDYDIAIHMNDVTYHGNTYRMGMPTMVRPHMACSSTKDGFLHMHWRKPSHGSTE
jgi:hypothetical protein